MMQFICVIDSGDETAVRCLQKSRSFETK